MTDDDLIEAATPEMLRSFAAAMRLDARKALEAGGVQAVLELAHENPEPIPYYAQQLDAHIAQAFATGYQAGLEAGLALGGDEEEQEQ